MAKRKKQSRPAPKPRPATKPQPSSSAALTVAAPAAPAVAARPAERTGEVFVLCPADTVTGGPDALHQLVHTARGLGYAAHLVYVPPTGRVPEPYAAYDLSIVPFAQDTQQDAVVVPEIWPGMFANFPRAKKVFWWLSWDYGAAAFDEVNRLGVLHACQSAYALDMVRRSGYRKTSAMLLSDFTRAEFENPSGASRRNLVAYFPAKGPEFSEKIISANPDLEFAPIRDMTPAQVHELLSVAKVYIDFGPHPGKDRIPREAAAAGCCVITSSDRGASAYREDVPIPRRYKFPTAGFDVEQVSKAIRDCLENYDERARDFELYRASVAAERWIFVEEVEELMERLGCRRTTG